METSSPPAAVCSPLHTPVAPVPVPSLCPLPVPTMAVHSSTPESPCFGLLSKLASPVSPRSPSRVNKGTGPPRGVTVTSV